jgi:hypothetical protein
MGIKRLISFSTPEGEVNGVVPVKFMVRYELMAVAMSTSPVTPLDRKSVV